MITLERIVEILLTVLVATLPFEFRTFPIISNLQWIFVGIAAAGLPLLLRARYTLLQDRRVIMAALFVFVQCLAALAAFASVLSGFLERALERQRLCRVGDPPQAKPQAAPTTNQSRAPQARAPSASEAKRGSYKRK